MGGIEFLDHLDAGAAVLGQRVNVGPLHQAHANVCVPEAVGGSLVAVAIEFQLGARRGDDGIIKEISDGIVFPILSALSRFVKQNKAGHWRVVYPRVFADEDMLIAARRQLSSCGGRPMLMGRSASAYEGLMTLTEMAVRYSEKAGAA